MPVIYNGTSIRPAPHVQFEEIRESTGDGRWTGTTIRATVTGTLTVEKTADTEAPVDITQKLSVALQKQQALRSIFSVDGAFFEVQGYDGSAPVKFNAHVESITFGDGQWTDVSDYTIVLTGSDFSGENTNDTYVSASTENWDIQEGDDPHTYRVSHSLSATGKTVYAADGTLPKKAWEYARDFVKNQLGLGYTTATAFSPTSGSGIVGGSPVPPDASSVFNRTFAETINELEGSYSATETFILAQNPYVEQYTVALRKVTDEPLTTTSVTVQGTIQGFYVNVHDYATRYANATTAWNNTIYSLLQGRAQATTSATLNTHPAGANVEYNPQNGTISYAYEYNDRKLNSDTLETYTVSKRVNAEDFYVTVSVEGTITGQLYADEVDPSLKFIRAQNRWNVVKPTLYARAQSDSGVNTLQPYPLVSEFSYDQFNGSVSYNYSFDDRPNPNVRDEYTVTQHYSREDGITTVTVDGTITGIRNSDTTTSAQRFSNAYNYWLGIQDQLFGRAQNYSTAANIINPLPYSKVVGENPLSAVITYSYEYTNQPLPCVPGALSEIITLTEDAAVPVIAKFVIPGRAAGPYLQDINTVTEKRRTIDIEIRMPPPTSMCSLPAPPYIDVTPYVPVANKVRVENDQTSWTLSNGTYHRQVAWVYQ